jgi:aminomethyltransferase
MEERQGWLLPAQFGNPAAEYGAIRSAVGFVDLSHRGLLQLTGPDRVPYLQGILSNDVKPLRPYEGLYAAFLSQQGKVLGDVRVLCSENSFYLDLWESIKDKILGHMNRYLVADEVEIADRSESYKMISLQGPKSEDLLTKLSGSIKLPAELFGHVMADICGAQVCVVRADYTGEGGFDLIVPTGKLEPIAQELTETGRHFSAQWVGEQPQNVARVEAGIARYGVDFTEDSLLLETGLNHAVSFTKGCYLGQEVVERIRSRGHVNKILTGLVMEGTDAPKSGERLLASDKEVGTITSSVISPMLKRPIALGYIHKDFWTPGTQLVIKGDPRQTATVTALPFVRQGAYP